VATQNPALAREVSGKAEFVVNFFESSPRSAMRLGFRSIAEAVGHTELLNTQPAIEHWKASG